LSGFRGWFRGSVNSASHGSVVWRWCSKCQCLAFGGSGAPGPCPAGDAHDHGASYDYWFPLAPQIEVELPSRRGEPPLRVRVEQPYSSEEVPGERGWRRCNRCQGFSKTGGSCVDGVPHTHDGSAACLIACNAPTTPGQAHWRLRKKCQTLSFGGGACFAGGTHDLLGSSDYTVRDNPGQNQWRQTMNCHGLWFSGGMGGRGHCPAPAGVHDAGTDDYFV
jgi:hypothetical protein